MSEATAAHSVRSDASAKKLPEGITANDLVWLNRAVSRKALVSPPDQSLFRVYAIIVYRPVGEDGLGEGAQRWVTGTNSECCFIGGCICAERSAAMQLREVPGGVARVEAVYLVSDLPAPGVLTPGVLCREFLLSQTSTGFRPETPVILGAAADDAPSITAGHECVLVDSVRRTSLGKLYPAPSAYLSVPRPQLVTFGTGLRAVAKEAMRTFEHADFAEEIRKAAAAGEALSGLHPIQYAAAARFSDGSNSTIRVQQRALEYGNTIDPITLLVPARRR